MFAKRLLQITLILAVLAACMAIPRSASAAGPCGSSYIVQPGDWLSKIANRCGVSLSALYAANPWASYYLYIYPGQVLVIPGGAVPYVPPPSGTINPSPGVVPTTFYFPSINVAPHVGSSYYGATAQVGKQLNFETTIKNNGNVSLQIVANLTPPSDWDVIGQYDDCPDALAAGSMCTYTWIFIPRVGGQPYVRVYVRGLYVDSFGFQRITKSPAFFFNVGS